LFGQNLGEQRLLIEEKITFFNASSSFKIERRTTRVIIHHVVLSVYH
jgi:hypothetical protein